jgi:hypothetical protein
VQRPATTQFDRELVLTQTGAGVYEGDASDLDAGSWTVDLEARRATAAQDEPPLIESRRRLWIKP